MDATTLETLKSKWRQRVAESIGEAINELKTHVPEFSPKYNALILLESRLNDSNLKNIQNTISDEALQIEYNQIRADLLLFISGLEVKDFELPASASKGKSGALLYKIPRQMELQRETKCLVRLAFDKPTIIKNIELTDDVEIRDVRVAEVMQVQLIDPSLEQPFQIRSFSDEEQFVEEEAYTEWIFYVKPVREGTFPLMLKVSVVEVVQGKERVRNIIWEETVEITATTPEAEEPAFKPTGLTIGGEAASDTTKDFDRFVAEVEDSGADFPEPTPVIPRRIPYPPDSPRRVVDPHPSPAPEPIPQKPTRKKRNLATPIAGALLIATVGAVMVYQFVQPNAHNTTESLYPDMSIEQMVKSIEEPAVSVDSLLLDEEPISDDTKGNAELRQPAIPDNLPDLEQFYLRLLRFRRDSMQLLNAEDSVKLEKLMRTVERQKQESQ